ncbi:hypothetical protein PO878_03335 [Iamia majanohamensis]|uniref:Uncharacterized protein n=1 Tax=Iamia majanohamensis TaxID=467976 RepID=A0AAE9Y8L9_9ACTN|nr:hypothetical protein [Iamia majanohamensis]WCO67756.1 hypothetical protein PO878_03335 [Iamia majanohamensis]
MDPPRPATGVVDVLRRRLDGTHHVDEWGLDPDLVALVAPLTGLRWSVECQWTERLPLDGPAVLVHNRVAGVSEPAVLAHGVREATGRHVRTPGLVDVAPLATVGRMLGAVVDRRDELTGLLRSGELVALPLARTLRSGHAGDLPTAALAPALDTGAAVVPVALVGHEVGRHWRLLVGEPVPTPDGRGPLAVAQVADAARDRVQALLDEAVPHRLHP